VEKSHPSKVRLFLALELPAAARAEVAAWRDRLLAGADWARPVPADSLHVTLVFLGWRVEGEAERIASLSEQVAPRAGAPRLAPGVLRAVPPRRARLLALDLDDRGGACTALAAGLASVLEEAGLHRPEKRPFWPHLTLARAKRGRRAQVPRAAGPAPAPFSADRLVLFRSLLHPHGARYEQLWSSALG